MDRRILFRGKSILTGEWVIGDLVQHRAPMEIVSNDTNHTPVMIERGTLDQYSGFGDCHGNMIFDRDIIAVAGRKTPYLVRYILRQGGYCIIPIDINGNVQYGKWQSVRNAERTGIVLETDKPSNVEIVGNLHYLDDTMIRFDIWLGKQQLK